MHDRRLQTADPPRRTDFDILREHARFLHTDDLAHSYEAQLARAYYDSLYKEFAIANLKHYRTRGIALRWRTEEEVLGGIGQYTCANQRCARHKRRTRTALSEYEVPFAYQETETVEGHVQRVHKEALVKTFGRRRITTITARKLARHARHCPTAQK
ncbi:hypothetical protein MVES_003518 [Malassezia vespertilionis]|uniref:Uncharacterized protein n=1 Tax=Malassezia vespertilionis TaxID=2020962 RepID=A0A2N1J7X2_9BASI|nr:hypothetical protein MVES_003518 [Malassezia vespertilionis]